MAAFWAVNRLSASAPVMFLGAIPFLMTSLDHWSTALIVPGSDSMLLVASGVVAAPRPVAASPPPPCHWAQLVGGPDSPALANRVLFQYSISGAKLAGTAYWVPFTLVASVAALTSELVSLAEL